MYEAVRCMILRTVRHDDRNNIVTAWSGTRGRVALTVASGGGAEARRRRAITMPLAIVEGEVDFRPGREIVSMRDMRPSPLLPRLASEPAKALTAMFLAEVLERLLQQTGPDAALFSFLAEAVATLDAFDSDAAVANFPVVFLARLSRYMGIRPDPSGWRRGRILDLVEGVYRTTAPVAGRWADADAARLARALSVCPLGRAGRLPLRRSLRREVLEAILEYYTMHHTPLSALKSLDVVTGIF